MRSRYGFVYSARLSESFEDVIRTAVSLGGDCDTVSAIAGSIAEGFYGVPEGLKSVCRDKLPEQMLLVLERFERTITDGI